MFFLFHLGHPLFSFVYCRMRFLNLGLELGGAVPQHNKSTRCGYKVNMAAMEEGKSTLLESNEIREKN